MFINPRTAIDEGWVTGNFTENSIQPNALDFTLDHLYSINKNKIFRIDENSKNMRGGEKIEPEFDPRYDESYWRLAPHTSYDGMSDFHVKIPESVAAYLIIRSTFNRNGLFITSGLYDSGYSGHIGMAIHNQSGPAFVSPGTRVGQIIFVESQNAGMYAGGYNHDEGTHHSEKEV